MTNNDILNLAVICKLLPANAKKEDMYADDLINFGGLIAALEREECANICDEVAYGRWPNAPILHGAISCAKAIRSIGKK